MPPAGPASGKSLTGTAGGTLRPDPLDRRSTVGSRGREGSELTGTQAGCGKLNCGTAECSNFRNGCGPTSGQRVGLKGGIVTRLRWLLLALLGIGAVALASWQLARERDARAPQTAPRSSAGHWWPRVRTEPATFNRYTRRAFPTHLIAALTQARLVRHQQRHPGARALARRALDGLGRCARTYTLRLRRGVRFSDGEPFTADDVLFSFAAAYDAKTASPLGDRLRVRGEPLVRACDFAHRGGADVSRSHTGRVCGCSISLPIYPRHRLARALADGSFATAWGPQTPPGEMTGLGPFVLTQYQPGQRSPSPATRTTGGGAGRAPAAVPRSADARDRPGSERGAPPPAGGTARRDAERAAAGRLPAAQAQADAGRVRVHRRGCEPRVDSCSGSISARATGDAAWLQQRRVPACAVVRVDREAFMRTVYLGAATPSWGLVSPGQPHVVLGRGSTGRRTTSRARVRCWPAWGYRIAGNTGDARGRVGRTRCGSRSWCRRASPRARRAPRSCARRSPASACAWTSSRSTPAR